MALNSTVGSPDADSYVSVAFATQYCNDRATGNSIHDAWLNSFTSQQEAVLRKGTSWLDGWFRGKWKGVSATDSQALSWPRARVENEDDVDIDETTIPRNVQFATIEAALRELTSPGSLTPDLGQLVVSETVGPISITFQQGAEPRGDFTIIDDLVGGLLRSAPNAVGGWLLRG